MADALRGHLGKYCTRCEVAGSIRRRKDDVKDIEIVACPDPKHYADFLATLRRYPILQGKPTVAARYLKLHVEFANASIAADVFITTPERWGWILVLRTGSSDFNIKLLQRLKANGVESKDGALWQVKMLDTPDEIDVFRLAGIHYVPAPGYRDEGFYYNHPTI